MGQWRAVVEIPATGSAPRAARRMAAAALWAWDLGDLVDDTELVVSELVTNAVQHAPPATGYELELTGDDAGVRISLADGSSIRPLVAELDHEVPSGRGMRIVELLAQSWGVDDHQGGKRVWVRIARRGGPR